MAIEKGLDPKAKASATSIIFKQRTLEKAAVARDEIIAVIGQFQTGKTGVVENIPVLGTGIPEDDAVRFGYGSPLHLASKKLYPRNGNGAKVSVYFVPLADDNSATAATGSIVVVGAVEKAFTLVFKYRETEFESAADACGKIATNAQLNPAKAPRGINLDNFKVISFGIPMPKGIDDEAVIDRIIAELDERPDVPFTYVKGVDGESNPKITFTAKWKGVDANKIKLEAVDQNGNAITDAVYGLDVTVLGMASGAGNSDIQTALDNLTEEFLVTRIVTQNNDETSLDQIQAWGEAMRDGLISQIAVAYHGYEYPESETVSGTVDVDALVTLADSRSEDAVNIMIGGNYAKELRSLTWQQRDLLLKKGISNIPVLSNGKYRLKDVCTFYHQAGVLNSILAFDRDLCVLGNIAYDLRFVFDYGPSWQSVVLVSDDEQTNNPATRSERDIKAEVNKRIAFYGLAAWLTNTAEAQELTEVEIDDLNPNRVNININGQLSGVMRITDIVNKLGFYFGS
jgi:phage tail sheath gpL-like